MIIDPACLPSVAQAVDSSVIVFVLFFLWEYENITSETGARLDRCDRYRSCNRLLFLSG